MRVIYGVWAWCWEQWPQHSIIRIHQNVKHETSCCPLLLQIGETGSSSIKLSREMKASIPLWTQFGCGQMSLLALKSSRCSQTLQSLCYVTCRSLNCPVTPTYLLSEKGMNFFSVLGKFLNFITSECFVAVCSPCRKCLDSTSFTLRPPCSK